tara:strand:+ start:169 stop:1557 length:1389 start_codon:yes stop_codon:yes gene_type:complete
MYNFKRLALILGIILFSPISVYCETTEINILKIRFLVSLKFKLILEDKYNDFDNNNLDEIVKKLLDNEFIEDSLCQNIKLNTKYGNNFSICKLLKSDNLNYISKDMYERYIYDSIYYDFETIKKAADYKLLEKIRKYSFSRNLENGEYYFILRIEIQQLLGCLIGYYAEKKYYLKKEFDSLSSFDFHKIIAKVLNNYKDAHLSLFSRFTYQFYSLNFRNEMNSVKFVNNKLVYVSSLSPLVNDMSKVDTLQLQSNLINTLDTLLNISKTEFLTDHFIASMIDNNKLINKDISNFNERKGVYILYDTVLYVDIQSIKKRSRKEIKKLSKKRVTSVIVDLRGYPEDPIIGYRVLNIIKKQKLKMIAVLINKNTYSLSEIFASKLYSLDNSVVMGECTAGAMGESREARINDAFALKYTAYWYKKEAYSNASFRKVCPQVFLKLSLPTGYITSQELETILYELGK